MSWEAMLGGVAGIYALKHQQGMLNQNAQQMYNAAYQQQNAFQQLQGLGQASPQMAGNMANNSLVCLQNIYGWHTLRPEYPSEQKRNPEPVQPSAGLSRADSAARKAKEADTKAKWDEILNKQHRRNAGQTPKLSLKTSPLFGHLKWDFESPFAKLSRWFVRKILAWRIRNRLYFKASV